MFINVLEMLEKTSEEFSDKAAVVEGTSSISFGEMAEKARNLGTAISGLIEKGSPVGVYMEKGIDAVCAFLGTLYAGCVYSMLNPELPDERIKQIQSLLNASLIITTKDLRPQAEKLFVNSKICVIDEAQDVQADLKVLSDRRKKCIDTDPVYVNYTSGSTGTPKAIVVGHRSVIDFIGCFTEIFSLTDGDIIANQAPFDFDVSVKDIYSSLYTGATLVIVPRKLFSDPTGLMDYLCDHQVTVMIWAVSALCLMTTFHCLDYRVPNTVNKILFSGEVMPLKHLKELQKHFPDAVFANLYGPTEITCNCTYHIIEQDRDYSGGIPIGVPFPNEDVFLLDKGGKRIQTPGEIGELVVRGTALALGYYHNDGEEGGFTSNPLNQMYQERIYRTGDLATYNDSGELLFHGRNDSQIKHMGHRIELGEIERFILGVEGVETCFCVYEEKKQKIKAYYAGFAETEDIIDNMRNKLPVFMIPGYFRKIKKMVLTKNGKLDRKKIIELTEENTP